jgi:DNA-binding CsgD family transcriptional regulator
MADGVGAVAVSGLVATLWSDVRALADEREVDLDLRLLGKPAELREETQKVVASVVGRVVASAREAGELHHAALEVSFGTESVSVRFEHDGMLDAASRAAVESAILSGYGEIGAVGGSLALSSGRGYGLRIEVTALYEPQTGAAPGGFERAAGVPSVPGRMAQTGSFANVEQLTSQEATTLNLLAAGLSNKEIAGRMHLGVGTVKFHLAQIYQKLGVQGRGRVAAVARARELGLIFD